jgi:hypothetical protein
MPRHFFAVTGFHEGIRSVRDDEIESRSFRHVRKQAYVTRVDDDHFNPVFPDSVATFEERSDILAFEHLGE